MEKSTERERDLSVEPLVVHGVPGGLATGRFLVRADVPATKKTETLSN